jgi:hypothetical protein
MRKLIRRLQPLFVLNHDEISKKIGEALFINKIIHINSCYNIHNINGY